MNNSTEYAKQMRAAAQIDETGKSEAWIERYGRDAMLAKTEEFFRRLAEWDELPFAAKGKIIRKEDNTDYYASMGGGIDNLD